MSHLAAQSVIPYRTPPREGDTLTLAIDAPAGSSGRGLVPGGAPGFDLGHHLGKRGEDRFIVQDLAGLDRQSQASLGSERRAAALAGPLVLCLARPADGPADLRNGLLPAQALGHDAGGQLGLRSLVLDLGDLVGGRGWQAPPLDLLLDRGRQLQDCQGPNDVRWPNLQPGSSKSSPVPAVEGTVQ